MRAAALTPDHGFEVVDVADPSPGRGELLLRVEACGICGSDLKAYDHMPVGAVLGHEFCGEVVGVGAEVDGWKEGDRASAMPLVACGTCRWCVRGEQAHCERIDYLGLGGSTGGFAELVRAGAATSSRLSADLGGLGALVEPLAVGLHAVKAGGDHVGQRVLVLGGGTVGAAVALWARRLGAAEVVVTDPSPDRRVAALTAGATDAVEPTGYDTGWDIVYECVGSVGMVATAIDAADVKGRVVIAGVCTAPDTFVPIAAVMKEVDMRFAVFYRHDEFALTARLLSEGQLPVDGFVTRRVGLEGVGAAFTDLKTAATTDRKILVVP
jgi:2-desacetyl-2-hydroxyethyl bacteriochlorophyllide A dehydrogenase